jgi:tetratricopeptide (TPR) repeat protein
MNEYDQGLKFCREKLANYEILLGKNHPRFVNTALRTASLLLKKDEFNEALGLCKRALTIILNMLPLDIHITIECLQYMSYIYQLQDDFDDSLEYRERQLEMERTIYPSNHPQIGWSLVCIGMIHYEKGQYAVSLDRLHEALAIYKGISPKKKDTIKTIREHIDRVEKRQAMIKKARAWSPVQSGSRKSGSKKSGSRKSRSRQPRSGVPTLRETTPVRSSSRGCISGGTTPVRTSSRRCISGGSTPVLSRSSSTSRLTSCPDLDLKILKLKLSLSNISAPDIQSEKISKKIKF